MRRLLSWLRVSCKLLPQCWDGVLILCLKDWTKISKVLCTKYARGIPIEILPASLPYVMERLKTLGAVPTLRMGGAAKAGPCVTDNGNFIIDAALPKGYRGRGEDDMKGLDNSAHVIQLARLLSGIVGVVEHGLFSQVDKKPNVVYFGMEDGTVQILGKKALNKL
jgi:ribose 5-phosphate isomerase A